MTIPLAVPRASPRALPSLAAYLRPFAGLFWQARSRPTWESVERYLTGLLTDLPRKKCDTITAAVASTTTERLQHLLTDAGWERLALDETRVRRLARLSPAAGVLVLDDTGLPKQGKASAGVARQYSRTLGKIATCQVIVSAEYVEDVPTTSTPLHWPVSAQLYLPERWVADAPRRQRAHVPPELPFQTKPEIALTLVERALAWGVRFGCVVADAGYGEAPALLNGLAARGLPYVCGVRRTFSLRLPDEVQADAVSVPPSRGKDGKGRPPGRRPAPLWDAETLTGCLPDAAWETVRWREGTKTTLAKQFVAVRVHRATGSPQSGRSISHHRISTGPAGWLLAERPRPGDSGEHKWYFCWLPADTPLERLVTLAHARWIIEQFYEDAKGECGFDDYQGRRWDGLHRHLSLVMLTYSFLAVQRLLRVRRRRARVPVAPHPAAPAAAGLSPLGGRSSTSPFASPTAPHLPGHPPTRPHVPFPGSRALDTHLQPDPSVSTSLLPTLLTK